MFYVFEDGRIVYDAKYLMSSDAGKYIEVQELPVVEPVDKMFGYPVANLTLGIIEIKYVEEVKIKLEPEVEPEPYVRPTPEPTDTELLMQANADAELRDLEIQQNQELLAQQMTDIELAVLGGEVS